MDIRYHIFLQPIKQNITTCPQDSFSKKSTINFSMLKPWKICHSSNTFFAHNSTCLLVQCPPLLTFSISFSSISRKCDFGIKSLTRDSKKLSSTTLASNVKVSKLKWITKPNVEEITWTLWLNTTWWSLASDVEVSKLKWTTKPTLQT